MFYVKTKHVIFIMDVNQLANLWVLKIYVRTVIKLAKLVLDNLMRIVQVVLPLKS